MTISFSGLASGLDTSSWITSLTALKQAKVTTLQQQKENLVLSRDTLTSIRSFFTSFRSMIERVTDTRFNVASMDLFAQKLAVSSNTSVLTATATPEATATTTPVATATTGAATATPAATATAVPTATPAATVEPATGAGATGSAATGASATGAGATGSAVQSKSIVSIFAKAFDVIRA